MLRFLEWFYLLYIVEKLPCLVFELFGDLVLDTKRFGFIFV